MNIPFVDLKTQYSAHQKEFDLAIKKVLTSGYFIQGPETIKFEKNFAKYLGLRYCLGLNSGTDALTIGLSACNLKQGDEVIIPVNTFIATAAAVYHNRLNPVFVDIDDNDYGINLTDLRKKINHRTKAVIVVHLHGKADKLNEIQNIIKKSGKKIFLIEDACQAQGSRYCGRKVGTFGIFGAFSFYPGKNLGAYGDAGAIVTNDSKLMKKAFMIREHGQIKKYEHVVIGQNSRLDTVQAAILLVKMNYLNNWNKKRQNNARVYDKKIHQFLPHVHTPQIDAKRQSIYHLYVIRVSSSHRDKLLCYLNQNGIQAQIHYPTPLHLAPAFRYLNYHKGSFPIAEKIATEIISLPMYPELTEKQIDYTINCLKGYFNEKV